MQFIFWRGEDTARRETYCDARPQCSHDWTIHCEWVADFVSSERVLSLLNKIWLSGHNAKITGNPQRTKVPLCCSNSSVRKATVLLSFGVAEDGQSGKRLGFQYGHHWKRPILNVCSPDEKHMNFNALHCSICGGQTERTLEAAWECEKATVTRRLCVG